MISVANNTCVCIVREFAPKPSLCNIIKREGNVSTCVDTYKGDPRWVCEGQSMRRSYFSFMYYKSVKAILARIHTTPEESLLQDRLQNF